MIKYCRFYEDHRQTIEECQQLKDEIERLIRDDTIEKFARKEREDRRLQPEVRIPENVVDCETVEVIHVIADGPHECKGKNKRAPEDLPSVQQELWMK